MSSLVLLLGEACSEAESVLVAHKKEGALSGTPSWFS